MFWHSGLRLHSVFGCVVTLSTVSISLVVFCGFYVELSGINKLCATQEGLSTPATSHWPHKYSEASPAVDGPAETPPAALSVEDLRLFGMSDVERTWFLQQRVCADAHLCATS